MIATPRYWRAHAIRGGCVMCRAYPLKPRERRGREPEIRTIQGHHVIAKQLLRTLGHADRYWDQRNGLGLCSYHHHRHEWRIQPVPFRLLRDETLEFAAELELLYLIEKAYPGIEDLR